MPQGNFFEQLENCISAEAPKRSEGEKAIKQFRLADVVSPTPLFGLTIFQSQFFINCIMAITKVPCSPQAKQLASIIFKNTFTQIFESHSDESGVRPPDAPSPLNGWFAIEESTRE